MDTTTAEALALFKVAKAREALKGKLYLSQTGFLLLSVPNAIGRGAFDALGEAGVELPLSNASRNYNAHVTVMRPEEIELLGGPEKITERGRDFAYSVGGIRDFNPVGWAEMSRCWVLEINSPELKKLRVTYGLPPLPVHEDSKQAMEFHCTFAVRRNGVLTDNDVSKAKAADKAEVSSIKLTDEPGVHLLKAAAEEDFLKWYLERAKRLGLDQNPDDPAHFYDYRAAYLAGDEPDETGHWPSVHKHEGHPNLVIDGIDTRTGQRVKQADDFELMGSRGRARKYGRPEPEDRDHDWVAFTDDQTKQQELMTQLRAMLSQGYAMKERPGGFLTASSPDADYSVYPTSKRDQIHQAWELQEGGMSKDDAWAQLKQAADLDSLRHTIITGAPGAGKTTRGRELAEETGRPLVSLDDVENIEDTEFPGTRSAQQAMRTLAEPSIVEGTAALGFDRSYLDNHDVELLDPSTAELVRRLTERGVRTSTGTQLQGRADAEAIQQEVQGYQDMLQQFKDKTADDAEAIRHILISGHSGSGKSTLSQQLAKEKGLPIGNLDKDPRIKARFEQVKNDRDNAGEQFRIFMSPNDQTSRDLSTAVVNEWLQKKTPHVIEGTQLAMVDPALLEGHDKILVDKPHDQIVEQRLGRDRAKGKFGDLADPEMLAARRDISQRLIDDMDPAMQAYGQGARVQIPDDPSETAPPVSEKVATVTLNQAVARAARKAVAPKSDAQAEAGNYRKGHVAMHGMQITIENKRGGTRSGVGADGKKWESKMHHHYGYIRRTEGADGDHVDVFVGHHPEAELAYVIDQVDPKTKDFDEHKCMMGFKTKKDAKEGYLANYADNWKGLGQITPLTMNQFKEWLKDGTQKRPISSQTFKMRMKKTAGDTGLPDVLVLQCQDTIRMVAPNVKDGDDGKTS